MEVAGYCCTTRVGMGAPSGTLPSSGQDAIGAAPSGAARSLQYVDTVEWLDYHRLQQLPHDNPCEGTSAWYAATIGQGAETLERARSSRSARESVLEKSFRLSLWSRNAG